MNNSSLLILVVEADRKAKTDFLYIDTYIRNTFDNPNKSKIMPVYMCGKSKFNSSSINFQINKLIKQYPGNVNVLFCIDIDNNRNKEIQNLNNKINGYCKSNPFTSSCYSVSTQLIWFNCDIEEVMLGKRVMDSDKVKSVKKFVSTNSLSSLAGADLKAADSQMSCCRKSNIETVICKYLFKKH